jgi:glycosyltransferase involved in cell wall biosynthesis
MKRYRLLIISTHFPNAASPHIASYSRQQIGPFSDYFDIDIVAPVHWANRIFSGIPNVETYNGTAVYHPTLYYIPKVLRKTMGILYYRSIAPLVFKLARTNAYDIIYSTWLYPDGWAAVKIANKIGIPCVCKAIGTDVNRLFKNRQFIDATMECLSGAAMSITVSNDLKSKLIQLGADEKKIEVVYNGVDSTVFRTMDKLSVRNELNLSHDSKILLYVGNILKEKGLDELVVAFLNISESQRFNDLQLVLIGQGTHKKNLLAMLDNHHFSTNVHFLGAKSHNEIAKWMNACDVFCLPSYNEGVPNVVLEALSCQARVVSTNVGGIPEIQACDNLLRLVNPHDVSALQRAIENSMDDNYSYCETFRYSSWQDNAQKVMNIFFKSIPFHNK